MRDANALLREVRRALDLYPGDVETLIYFYSALRQHGRTREAKQLYDHCVRFHEAVCTEFPRHAVSHKHLAWLAARCGRDLDQALKHARRAVELEPSEASYHAALGEVYFQRGQRGQALEAMAQCLRLAPDSSVFRRQCERIAAGDPKAPLPN
jgi:tetratricopeptide (TPR) repeat protein